MASMKAIKGRIDFEVSTLPQELPRPSHRPRIGAFRPKKHVKWSERRCGRRDAMETASVRMYLKARHRQKNFNKRATPRIRIIRSKRST